MTDAALDYVLSQAGRLPFVVLVTWLDRLLGAGAAVGGQGPYDGEPIRFQHDPRLSFHDGDIVAVELVEQGRTRPFVQLTTSFAGLTGTASPLPPSMIERLCREDDEDEAVQRDFLNLFHHRLLSHFYRGLLKYDLPRSTRADGTGRTLDWVLLLAGLAPVHAERLTGISRSWLISLAPLLVAYPASAERIAVALRFALADLLADADVRIAEMRGKFTPIAESARARLGVDMLLGRTSTLGGRAPCPSSEIMVQMGPLSAEACSRLRPGGDRFGALRAVATLFCPENVEVAVELTPTSTPPFCLGKVGARLGRNAWLKSRGRPLPICFALDACSARKNQDAS